MTIKVLPGSVRPVYGVARGAASRRDGVVLRHQVPALIQLLHPLPPSGNPCPFTNPPFYVYPMDMTWILQHQVYFLAKCHIHVISMSYLFFKKDIFGYTWYILN